MSPKTFYQCGCCDQFHPWNFTGDCRDDANRFSAEDLPEGWQEVSQADADDMLEAKE